MSTYYLDPPTSRPDGRSRRSFPTVFTGACGYHLVDETGREYVDFFSGAGALNYGHNNPVLKRRLIEYLERDGITHVLDVVGREHYPTVASFIDEARRLGVSRRAPRTIDFARISPASRLLLAHAHADIANAAEFPCDDRCPCHTPEHLVACPVFNW